MSGEYVDTPATFPTVTIIEADNAVVKRMRTSDIENAVSVMYEVNVYTNSVGYKKSEAKDIMSTVDEAFSKLGFTRITCNPISNLRDATIYRIVARYQAEIDRNLCVYQDS